MREVEETKLSQDQARRDKSAKGDKLKKEARRLCSQKIFCSSILDFQHLPALSMESSG